MSQREEDAPDDQDEYDAVVPQLEHITASVEAARSAVGAHCAWLDALGDDAFQRRVAGAKDAALAVARNERLDAEHRVNAARHIRNEYELKTTECVYVEDEQYAQDVRDSAEGMAVAIRAIADALAAANQVHARLALALSRVSTVASDAQPVGDESDSNQLCIDDMQLLHVLEARIDTLWLVEWRAFFDQRAAIAAWLVMSHKVEHDLYGSPPADSDYGGDASPTDDEQQWIQNT